MANVVKGDVSFPRWKEDLGGGKASVGRATFAWVRKRTDPSDLRVRLGIASPDKNEWLPTRLFQGDETREAEKEASDLIRRGESRTVWVEKQVHVAGYIGSKYINDWITIESQRFDAGE